MKRESNYNDKGDRVNSRDDGGYTCRTDKDRGTCTNNRTGESVNVSRNNDNSWSIDTSNTGNRNTFGSNYPSNFRDDKDTGGGYSGNSGGNFESESSKYGLDNLKELPRIANEKEFAATCHGSIAVNSIIDHAITRNSQGYGPNALASLKTFNLSHNYLGDEEIKKLNAGLYGYTLNLQVFNFCNNKMGAVGLDHLIKGAIGIDHLRKGGNDINNMMQGMLTLPSTSIVCLNLANNNIGDIGADILGHALANSKLPATKYVDISGNNITETGDTKIVQALKGVWQDIAVFTHKLDEIVKMGEGTKEEKIDIYKAIVEKGKALGTYDKAMVVDKSWFGKIAHIRDEVIFKGKWLFGFTKCHVVPDPKEEVTSYAQDKIIATLPAKTATGLGIAKKGVGVLTKHYDFVTCFISTTDAIWSSELGQQIAKHELCLLGEQDFCHGEQ